VKNVLVCDKGNVLKLRELQYWENGRTFIVGNYVVCNYLQNKSIIGIMKARRMRLVRNAARLDK